MYHVPLAFQCIYMDAVMKEVKREMGRRGMRFQEEGREWRLPGILYADDLVLCGESEARARKFSLAVWHRECNCEGFEWENYCC